MVPPESQARPPLRRPAPEFVEPGDGPRPASGVREALLEAARHELDEYGGSGISLRAVARRAGVSHAAPKHHFRDRAGLLTTLAADGHQRLAAALRSARDSPSCGVGNDSEPDLPRSAAGVVAELGRAYVEFGLANGALFDLMFRTDQLHPRDPDLVAARAGSLGVLTAAIDGAGRGDHGGDEEEASTLALAAWTFAHGLVVLVRNHALDDIAAPATADGSGGGAHLSHALTDLFAHRFLSDSKRSARPPGSP